MFVDFLTMVWRKLHRSGMTMNHLLMPLLMELTDSETTVAIYRSHLRRFGPSLIREIRNAMGGNHCTGALVNEISDAREDIRVGLANHANGREFLPYIKFFHSRLFACIRG